MATSLPTQEELEQLYHKKGKKALVWYAWRSNLRVLPLLGRLPLREIWKKNTLKHSFSVCRVSVLLANVPTMGMPAAADADAALAARAAAAALAARADYDFLINNTEPLEQFWFSRPLWKKTWLSSSEPKKFTKNLESLLKQLGQLGLGFLADDLRLIYSTGTKPQQKHWKQYLESPSDAVFESAESLRRFIGHRPLVKTMHFSARL